MGSRAGAVIAFFYIFFMEACKTTNSDNTLQHEWGQTSVPANGPIGPCEGEHDARMPLAKAYLEKIFEHIAQSNQDAFREEYAPEHFCFGVNEARYLFDRNNRHVNGYASENGFIALTPWTFLNADSDADIAGLLGHELAHVTMRHGFVGVSKEYRRYLFRDAYRSSPRLVELDDLIADARAEKRAMSSTRPTNYELHDSHFTPARARLIAEDPSFQQKHAQLQEALEWWNDDIYSSGKYSDLLPMGRSLWYRTHADEYKNYDRNVREPYADSYQNLDTESLEQQFLQLSSKVNEGKQRVLELREELRLMVMNTLPDDVRGSLETSHNWYTRSNDLGQRITAWDLEHRQILELYGYSRYVLETLREQQADEVGFEFYARAGYPLDKYGFMARFYALNWERLYNVSNTDFDVNKSEDLDEILVECRRIRDQEMLGIPYRNTWQEAGAPYRVTPGRSDSHPLPCWRLYNIVRKEQTDHSQQLADLQTRLPARVLNPSLEEVKAEISQYFSAELFGSSEN